MNFKLKNTIINRGDVCLKTIERIKCGNGNCYLIHENNKAVLVDTARPKYRDKILDICKNANVTLIVLTHGHIDHVQNAAWLSKALQVPIAMHKSDINLIKNNLFEPLFAHSLLGKLVLALSFKIAEHENIDLFEPSVYLQEGDSLSDYGIDATVVELPGHTKGSIGLKIDDSLIVGDALMNMFYPIKSMLYTNREQMEKSAAKISNLKINIIYFGHGKSVSNRNW